MTLIRRLVDGSEAVHEVAKCGHEYMVPTWAKGAWPQRVRCDWCSTGHQRDQWDALVSKRQEAHRRTAVAVTATQQAASTPLATTPPSPCLEITAEDVATRTCAVCSVPLNPRGRSHYCSQRCRRLSQFEPRTCAHPSCDQTFRTGDAKRRCCSAKHNRALYRLEHPEHHVPESIEVRRERWQRRRALKRHASTGQPVRLNEIAERDDWTCQLCSTSVNPDAVWPDPKSKSLDHIVPLSRGGAHDPSNVQLAHLACNVRKGSTVP